MCQHDRSATQAASRKWPNWMTQASLVSFWRKGDPNPQRYPDQICWDLCDSTSSNHRWPDGFDFLEPRNNWPETVSRAVDCRSHWAELGLRRRPKGQWLLGSNWGSQQQETEDTTNNIGSKRKLQRCKTQNDTERCTFMVKYLGPYPALRLCQPSCTLSCHT